MVSVEKRIMLHLLNYHRVENKFDVPFALTQCGIAEAISTKRNYVSSSVKKLIAKGHVREYVGRGKRAKKMQKYILLTNGGREYAGKLKKKLSGRHITMQLLNGSLRMMKLRHILPYLDKKEICPDATELDIYKMVSTNCIFLISFNRPTSRVPFFDIIL